MSDANICFELPWPPSANHYWFLVACKGGGRKVIGKKGKQFRECVAEHLKDCDKALYEKRLEVSILVFPPDKRKRDLDNLLKASLDAIEQAGVFKDDAQIDRLTIIRSKQDPEKKGYMNVHIKESKDE